MRGFSVLGFVVMLAICLFSTVLMAQDSGGDVPPGPYGSYQKATSESGGSNGGYGSNGGGSAGGYSLSYSGGSSGYSYGSNGGGDSSGYSSYSYGYAKTYSGGSQGGSGSNGGGGSSGSSKTYSSDADDVSVTEVVVVERPLGFWERVRQRVRNARQRLAATISYRR